MLERALYSAIFSETWGRQMRFITGPRQSGKTTLAKLKLERERSESLYYLWDLRSVRNRYKANELFFTEDSPPRQKKQWVCFDEIHKIPKWKNALKGIFDSVSDHYQFIITGSAKLDIFRKAGDSLSGRFFTFHLFPLSLSELSGSKKFSAQAPKSAKDFIQERIESVAGPDTALSDLLEYGGFPEPFTKQSGIFLKKWAEDYTDTVIREDIGALTRIVDKEYLHDLYYLLPQVVGNPLSESSLASHLELSHPTIKSYLKRLDDFYLAFKVHPYSKNIKRAILKAPKVYLYDWTRIKDPGPRFENYVAVELVSRLDFWTQISEGNYALFYIRNKEKQETDFLILKDNVPWLLVETKWADGSIARHHYQNQRMLGQVPLVQICREPKVCKMEAKDAYHISASRFLG